MYTIRQTTSAEMLDFWNGRYADFAERISARVDSGVEECWMIRDEEADKWIGELHVRWNKPDQPDEANGVDTAALEAFRIEPEYQGRRLGTMLMARCINRIREKGFTRATIGADDSDPKLAVMYQKWGFTNRIREDAFDFIDDDGTPVHDTYVLFANEDVQHTGLGIADGTSAKETLTIFDEEGNPVGFAPRAEAHLKGLRHHTIHIWIAEKRVDGWWIWFQQRAFDKKDFPGMYDTAVGGHIGHGEDIRLAAVREMSEEIGLDCRDEDLLYLGDQWGSFQIPGFFDREIARVFVCIAEEPRFAPGAEVVRMVRVKAEDFLKMTEGADSVAAVDHTGKEERLLKKDWCLHAGEFTDFVLPKLRSM